MKTPNVVSLLQQAYAGELETVQNYLANSVWLDGLRAQEIVEALANDITDELGHAEKVAQRLKQLGVCPPGSLALVLRQVSLQPSADPTDLHHVVTGVLEAERAAIANYEAIITAAGVGDPVTADLAVRILADEEKHRCLFEGFLKGLEQRKAA